MSSKIHAGPMSKNFKSSKKKVFALRVYDHKIDQSKLQQKWQEMIAIVGSKQQLGHSQKYIRIKKLGLKSPFLLINEGKNIIGTNVTTAQLANKSDDNPLSCFNSSLGIDINNPTTEKTMSGTQIK